MRMTTPAQSSMTQHAKTSAVESARLGPASVVSTHPRARRGCWAELTIHQMQTGWSHAPDSGNHYWRFTDGRWRLYRRCGGGRGSKAEGELGCGRQEDRRR